MKEEALNLVITVVINLFVLSMVSERLVNFLKLNFQKLYTWKLLPPDIKRFLKVLFGNFRDKENSKKNEKLRERGVLNWAIFCSMIIAFCSQADLFYLIKCGELSMDIPFEKVSKIGMILTALFMSLGSKFWHDLLDILYFYKNARQKLSDGNLPIFDTADAVEEYVKLPYSKIYQNLVVQNPQYFGDPNVLYTLNGAMKRGSENLPCIYVHVKSKASFNIPSFLKYQMPNSGSSVSVKVIVIEDTLPKIHAIENGEGVKNDIFPSFGTLCCIMSDSDGNRFALTCNHVLNNRSQTGIGRVLRDTERNNVFLSDSFGNDIQFIGEWHYSLCNYYLDIALIKLTQGDDISSIPQNLSTNIYTLKKSDKRNLEITMKGLISRSKDGVVVDFDSQPIPIQYSDGIRELESLIVLGKGDSEDFDYSSSSSISQGGDSGALIYSRNSNQPVGMIVAGSTLYSFAIPLSKIFAKDIFKNMTIITN